VQQRIAVFRLVLDVGQKQVVAHSHPYLRQDGILAGSEERFDLQVLLDPFEEQFYLPPGFVYLCDRCGCKSEIVGQKHECLLPLIVIKFDQPEVLRILVPGMLSPQGYPFIAYDPSAAYRMLSGDRGKEVSFAVVTSCLLPSVTVRKDGNAPEWS
jgi:hypothetical protein